MAAVRLEKSSLTLLVFSPPLSNKSRLQLPKCREEVANEHMVQSPCFLHALLSGDLTVSSFFSGCLNNLDSSKQWSPFHSSGPLAIRLFCHQKHLDPIDKGYWAWWPLASSPNAFLTDHDYTTHITYFCYFFVVRYVFPHPAEPGGECLLRDYSWLYAQEWLLAVLGNHLFWRSSWGWPLARQMP